MTNKTGIEFALKEHPTLVGNCAYRYHSPITSAESCGFTNFPWGSSLISFRADELALALG